MVLTLSIILSLLLGFCLGFFPCFISKNKLDTKYKLLEQSKSSKDDLMNLIKKEFTDIANATIVEKQQKIQEQSASIFEEKMKPVMQKVMEFQDKVEKFNKTEIENNVSLMKQFEILEKNNKMISDEAQKLTNALVKNQNIKGAWGENLLSTILDSSGMQENVHYFKHFHARNLEDKIIYPDIVIKLPNDKSLIIDSKFTLTNFIELCSNDDEESLDKFKKDVKTRIDEIIKKDYLNAVDITQPDFVLIYLPLENSVATVYQDQTLIQYALNNNIIIVGTSSVLATVRLVNQLWAKEKNNESVMEIVKCGVSLYDTFVTFCEDMKALQAQFDSVSKQFNKILNRFTRNNPKNPSMFSQIEKLKDYGITSTKSIPSDLLEETEEEMAL